jgi:hypothetical protein
VYTVAAVSQSAPLISPLPLVVIAGIERMARVIQIVVEMVVILIAGGGGIDIDEGGNMSV